MCNDESKQFPRDLLNKLCTYFDCDINELLVVDQKEPRE
ncbi:helix-turn-helix domain-containing protein [Paenibacillus thiaminolyticus]